MLTLYFEVISIIKCTFFRWLILKKERSSLWEDANSVIQWRKVINIRPDQIYMDSLAELLGRQKDIHIQQPIRRKVSHNKYMCRGHMVQIINAQSKYFDFISQRQQLLSSWLQIFAASHTIVFFLNMPNQFK